MCGWVGTCVCGWVGHVCGWVGTCVWVGRYMCVDG